MQVNCPRCGVEFRSRRSSSYRRSGKCPECGYCLDCLYDRCSCPHGGHVDNRVDLAEALFGAEPPALQEKAMFDLLLNLFEDEGTKDITFELSDGRLAAHRLVLKQASHVWSRMFDTDMAEKGSGIVKMPEVNVKTMQVFMRLLYTAHVCKADWAGGEGAGADDAEVVPLSLLLGVVSLAEKYMVQNALSIATAALKARLQKARGRDVDVDVDTFAQIAAAAIKEDIVPLRMAAMDAARQSLSVRRKFEASQFPPEVQYELEALWPAASPRPQKMTRLVR